VAFFEDLMHLSLYDITVPVLIRELRILDKLLDLGQGHADSAGIAHDDLLNARLADNMMTFIQQVQRVSDTSKMAAVRIGGVANVPMADEETTFAQLKQRVAATISFLEGVSADAINAGADKEIVLPSGGGQRTYSAKSYVLEFMLPNFFFHLTTAYAILRHKGVPIGKPNYLGWA
jgi:hypothetical protein